MKIYAFTYFLLIPVRFFQGDLLQARSKISGGLVVAYVAWFLLICILAAPCGAGRGIYMKAEKQIAFLTGSAVIFLGGWFLIVNVAEKWVPAVYLEVPALLYIAGWAVLWLLSEWYQKKRAARLAVDYPWID